MSTLLDCQETQPLRQLPVVGVRIKWTRLLYISATFAYRLLNRPEISFSIVIHLHLKPLTAKTLCDDFRLSLNLHLVCACCKKIAPNSVMMRTIRALLSPVLVSMLSIFWRETRWLCVGCFGAFLRGHEP